MATKCYNATKRRLNICSLLYPTEELVKEVSQAYAVPINGIVWMGIFFEVFRTWAATKSTHVLAIPGNSNIEKAGLQQIK